MIDSHSPWSINLVTTNVQGAANTGSTSSTSFSCRDAVVRDLYYTYDPANNITQLRDDARQRVFFKDQVVDPSCSYTYDALYRLIEASGREHLGQSGSPVPYGSSDSRQTKVYSPGDGRAMGRYLKSYYLDAVGNILRLQHSSNDPTQPGWTRRYKYGEASQIQPNVFSNRLSSTEIGASTEKCRYDGDDGLNGNITSMPHLPLIRWDFRDQLQSTAVQRVQNSTPETTWYPIESIRSLLGRITMEFSFSTTTAESPVVAKIRVSKPRPKYFKVCQALSIYGSGILQRSLATHPDLMVGYCRHMVRHIMETSWIPPRCVAQCQ